MKLKMKKYAIPAIILMLVILSMILNWNKFSQGLYLAKDSLTSEVKENTLSYKTAVEKDSDYLVYFYDLKQCEKCGEYVKELKKYEKLDNGFPIYKVNLAKLEPEVISEKLFIDATQPYVFHIKAGEDFYSYIGGFTADKLPTKNNQADAL